MKILKSWKMIKVLCKYLQRYVLHVLYYTGPCENRESHNNKFSENNLSDFHWTTYFSFSK